MIIELINKFYSKHWLKLNYFRQENGDEVAHLDTLSQSMLEQYGRVMDEKEENQGLRNYSGVVTALANGQENGEIIFCTCFRLNLCVAIYIYIAS